MTVARYWHTLRHLKAQQFVCRAWFSFYRPRPDLRPVPPLRRAQRSWVSPEWRSSHLTAPTNATFLNQPAEIASAPAWQDISRGRLWLYHLHYFDDLTARAAAHRRSWHVALISRWIKENPPGQGAGWEPYPTSLRIANWIKWLLSYPDVGQLGPDAATSLAVQARWLKRRLECHILGNHLWANAKALLMAGAFFTGPESDAWRRKGLETLTAQLNEQILTDGGHFERSPMYHAIILEDILDLIQLAGVFENVVPAETVQRLRAIATLMLRWLRVMTHPDGEISFFNDAAFDIAARYRAMDAYAHTVGLDPDERPIAPVEWLRESGYVRLTNERAAVLCDVAPVGPDYQPGHAHADTLSFELSVDGRRVVVNGGTSTYTPGAERSRQRGTAAHSTVEVDGLNSSDVWGAFRVARRARPLEVRAGGTADGYWVEAAHDGYRHRPGHVVHRRTWRLDHTGLSVTDELEGSYETAVSRFMLHPDMAAQSASTVQFSCEPASPLRTVAAHWHPRFGESQDTVVVEVALVAPQTTTRLTWS